MRSTPDYAARMEDDIGKIIRAIGSDARLLSDFDGICDCGGRRCGDDGEAEARALLSDWLGEIALESDGAFWSEPLPYQGWKPLLARVRPPLGPWRPVEALLWSKATPPGGLDAPVVDLGRGTRDDFERSRDSIPGSIVIVRHEYMFAPDHIHRSVKYDLALAFGAAGFLIAAETIVAGGSGSGSPDDIPAAGIDEETARLLAAEGRACLEIDIAEGPAETENLFLDLPGAGEGQVVLSAHIDGHAPGESALDNGSGLVACLSAARALAGLPRRRSLRVGFFSLEEWGLEGSRRHIAAQTEDARKRIALNVNLDTVAGSDDLTALTSDFPALEPFLREVGGLAGVEIPCFAPLRRSSDHYNFAVAGIPAFRLVAGFGKPESNVRHLLTAADTRDKATPTQLRTAATVAAIASHLALNSERQF